MKILIVDDIKENLYLLESLLKGSGYEVASAKDGIEALDKLKEESIDLIISDILMPRMDGFQLCRECKKDHRLKKIPFIFYTATYRDKKDEMFGLSLGAAKYIAKPMETEAFLKILKEVIEEHKKGKHIAHKEPIKEEEAFFEKYNKRLIQKLGKKMLDLEKANKILQDKEEKIYNLTQFQDNIINNANVWINVLDEKANVIIWNKAAEKISGYSSSEVIGHDKIWEWLYPDEKYRKKITIKAEVIIKKGEVDKDIETRICRKDGEVKTISWNSRNLSNPQGKIIGSVALGRDITEYKQAEQKIEKIQSLRNAIININHLLVRVKNESELFQQICNFLIKVKEIRFVWIGLTNSENFEVKPVAQAGFEEGYLSSIKITWDDSKYGNGPIGTALKTSQPFIIRSIEDDFKCEPWRNAALKRDYLSSIALPLIYKKENVGILKVFSGIKDAFTNEKVKFLKEVAEDITIGIKSLRLELKLKQSYQSLKKTVDATIETMSKIIEVRDPYTSGHQQRVSQLASAIAKELNLSPDNIEGIRIASLIHDIGKISIPTEILSKSTKLSDLEFSLIKEHSQTGFDILKSIDFSFPVAQIVLQHHERLNGSGYPHKLNGDKILLEAKIIGVADVVEAMSSHRPYRPALGIDAALEEISKNKGILYDPEVVDVCLKLFKEKRFKFE